MPSIRQMMQGLGLAWLLLPGPMRAEEAPEARAPEVAAPIVAGEEGPAPSGADARAARIVSDARARLRWGLGGFGGPFFPSTPLCFPVGGVEYRAGAQLNHRLAVLGTIALGTGGGRWDGAVKLAGWVSVGALAELSLSDRLFVAAGPGVALGTWMPLGGETVLPDEVAAAGPFFTADLRLGVALGGRAGPTGSRRHLTLGVDLLSSSAGGPSRSCPRKGRRTAPTFR